MQVFKCNGRTDGIICKQFQSSSIKEKKGQKYNASHKEEISKNGVMLIVLNDNETEDATSLSKKDKDEMLIMTKKDIQELKDRRTMY
jgi:hypothetical protein